MVYILEHQMSEDDTVVSIKFRSSKEAAKAAWIVCEQNNLNMPSADWTYDHPRYGEQDCYNIMVPSEDDDDWEASAVFINFMAKMASRHSAVEISSYDGVGFIRIYRQS